jgi:hypothetical protein
MNKLKFIIMIYQTLVSVCHHLPLYNYCFLNETPYIRNYECIDNITYLINTITYETEAEVYIGLSSPWNAVCPFGNCSSSTTVPGYDFSVNQDCVDPSQKRTITLDSVDSMLFKVPPNTDNKYYITLYNKNNGICSYTVTKGAIFTNTAALCTVPRPVNSSNIPYCQYDTKPSWELTLVSVMICIFSIIFITLLVVILRRKEKKHSLNEFYNLENITLETGTQTAEYTTDYIKLQ